MRTRRYRIITTLERLNNRMTRAALRRGLAPGAFALLETTGRHSGLPRHTPVGNGLEARNPNDGNGTAGDTFWLIAAHGDQADYVRNLRADPHARVKVAGRWRSGIAVFLPDDDTDARSRTLPYGWDAAIGRMMATAPLTIRIDHDPDDPPENPSST